MLMLPRYLIVPASRLFLSGFLLLAGGSPATAQPYNFLTYSIAEGLPQ